jgi:hypothetical protein
VNRDDIIRMARGVTAFDARWYESIQPGDFVADKVDGSVAVVVSVHKQRPTAPDYFRLDFADGSYMDATDNEMAAEYRPFILPSRIAAAEREACAKVCEEMWGRGYRDDGSDQWMGHDNAVQSCAAAIRARGTL